MKQKKYFYLIILLIFCSLGNINQKVQAAENIYLYRGTFSRIISINDLDKLVKEKQATKKLQNIMRLSNQNEEQLLKILNYEIEIPVHIVSKLMYSSIGEIILQRVSEIIYPNKFQKNRIGILAIRSAILKGSAKSKGKLTIIQFFQAYPNKNIAINLNHLSNTLSKIESLSELIKFYSNSPLLELKEGRSKT